MEDQCLDLTSVVELNHPDAPEIEFDARAVLVNLTAILLSVFAGPYRVVAYKPRTFGGIGSGLAAWLGIIIGYPICFLSFSGNPMLFVISWLVLVLAGWVQMFAKWCAAVARDQSLSHFWLGHGEVPFAIALSSLAACFIGIGAGLFFFAGYACSAAMLRMLNWSSDDTERLLIPARSSAESAVKVSRAGVALTGKAATASRDMALVAAKMMIPGLGLVLRGAKAFLRKRSKPPVEGYRPPSFMSRVYSAMVANVFLQVLFGTVSIWGLLKYFSFILAIPLAIIGWELKPPEGLKKEGHDVITRAKEIFREKKEDALKEYHQHKGEIGRGIRHKVKEEAWKTIND